MAATLPSLAYAVRDRTSLSTLDVIYGVTPSATTAPPGGGEELEGVLFGAWSAEGDLEPLLFGAWSGTTTQLELQEEDWSAV